MTKIREIIEKYRKPYTIGITSANIIAHDEDFDKLEKELQELMDTFKSRKRNPLNEPPYWGELHGMGYCGERKEEKK